MSFVAAASTAVRARKFPDRRVHFRYSLAFGVQYNITGRTNGNGPRTEPIEGTGSILNISSGGLLFEADRALNQGAVIDLSVDWPVLLDNRLPLKLKIRGKIIRTNERLTAVQLRWWEFHTRSGRSLAR